MRNVLAVVAGFAVGMIANWSILMFNGPMPESVDPGDPEQMNAWVATLPTTALLVVVAAHLAQSYMGGWVAARLSASRPMLLAMIVGVVSLAGGIYMMTIIDGPKWMVIELPLYLVVAWLAGRTEVRRRAATAG